MSSVHFKTIFIMANSLDLKHLRHSISSSDLESISLAAKKLLEIVSNLIFVMHTPLLLITLFTSVLIKYSIIGCVFILRDT